MKIKILKAKAINPVTKAIGWVARVVTNGTATFEDLCEGAARNTTLPKSALSSDLKRQPFNSRRVTSLTSVRSVRFIRHAPPDG